MLKLMLIITLKHTTQKNCHLHLTTEIKCKSRKNYRKFTFATKI